MATLVERMGRRRRAPKPPKARTVQFRDFRGINLSDARTAIDDDEFHWLENAITIGKGAVRILPGVGSTLATIAGGIASLWGFTLNGSPVLISINSDGSISQITVPGGVVTTIAGAATVTTSAVCTIWRGTDVLILDPTTGYFGWNGTTFTTISASRTGNAIAVFEGRAWLGNGVRTISYTAPNTFDNFTAGDGAGSTILTDEAFPGNILELHSTIEQLWIVGQGGIDTISNVSSSGTSPNVTTTFSVTNIVTNLGSNVPRSVIGYFRALAFMAPFGAYAISGVTPQKLSGKLDGLFPDLTLTNVPAAIAIIESLPCLLFLVRYTGSEAQAGAGPIQMLLGFVEGKWFFAVQNTALEWITTVIVSGVSRAYGTDGSGGRIFQLFGGAASASVSYKVQSKLYDFGLATVEKAVLKVGFELQATQVVDPTLTIDSEYTSQNVALTAQNTLQLQNSSGVNLTILNSSNNPLTIISQGMVLSRQQAAMYGRYIGWTISGSDPPYYIRAVQLEIVPTREWQTYP